METDFERRSCLPPEFYDRPVEIVARDLLGSGLVAINGGETIAGVIVETEAYGDEGDHASHAAFRRTGLVQAMWGPPGTLYVYKAYGMYPCFNVVTGPEGIPSAVLIRAMRILQPQRDDRAASGPGRLGRSIGLDIRHNGHHLTRPPFLINVGTLDSFDVTTGTRVGVKRGDQRPWRFAIAGHPAVSRPRL
jgi:DNA-3-methyladenine glycosylase